jgi:hypothetical protein
MDLTDLKFTQRTISHLAMETYHSSISEITITSDGPLNGKVFYCESKTRKGPGPYGNFGKTKVVYYFENDRKVYNNIESLLKSLNHEK